MSGLKLIMVYVFFMNDNDKIEINKSIKIALTNSTDIVMLKELCPICIYYIIIGILSVAI